MGVETQRKSKYLNTGVDGDIIGDVDSNHPNANNNIEIGLDQ